MSAGVGVGIRRQAVDGSVEDGDRLVDAGKVVGVEPFQQAAKLALVELSKTLEQVARLGCRRDDDVAPVMGGFASFEKLELDETVDQLTGRRGADPEAGGKLGH